MRALGIDCATNAGWAVVERMNGRERLLDHGVLVLDGKQLPAWNPVAALALRCRKEGLVPDVVAIELPYLGKNVVTLRTLARLFGRFEQAFEPTGVEIVEIMATKWQHKVLGKFGGKKREDLKKAAVLWARATFGVPLTDDEADAAGGAVCVLRERAFAARVKGAMNNRRCSSSD